MDKNCHHNLKISFFPLTKEGLKSLLKNKAQKTGNRPYIYATNHFKDYLNPSLINIFDSLNISPDTLVIFGHENDRDFHLRPMIHSDIRFCKNSWIDSPCAINWEITDSTAQFYWWDVKGAKKCYPPAWNDTQYFPPPDSDSYFEKLLASGIHYTKWMNFNSENYSRIDSCMLNNKHPILIRTDIPHSVEYSNFKDRISVSLRFPVEQISSWDSAVEIFKNLI